MYSTSRDQRIGDLVDKDIMTIDETTLISDSARIMKNKSLSSIFVTSLRSMALWDRGRRDEVIN
jgi:predicted transcriptional regulator